MKLSEETRKKISEKCKLYCGKNHSQYGVPRSKETKEKLKEACKGNQAWNKGLTWERMKGKNNPSARSVICSTGEIFSTMNEAAKWAGVDRCNIGASVAKGGNSGRHPDTGEKLKWRYYEN